MDTTGSTGKSQPGDGAATPKPPRAASARLERKLPVCGVHTPFTGTDVDFVDGRIICKTKALKDALHEFFQYETDGCHAATVVHDLGLTPQALKAATTNEPQDGGDIVVDVRC